MIQKKEDAELKIKRSLELLSETLNTQNVQALLPAITFTTKLVENYVKSEQNHIKNSYYEMMLVKLIEGLQKRLSQKENRQFRNLSKNKQKIVGDLLQYLQKYKSSTEDYIHLQNQQQKNQRIKVDFLIKNIYKFYEQHNLDKAYDLICQLNQMELSLTKSILMQEHQDKIKKIEKEYHQMDRFYSQFSNFGWIFDVQKNNMTMYYKVFEEEKTIAVKIESELQVQMLPFLAIISQVELHKTYVPFTEVSDLVKDLGRNKKAAYSKANVPFLTNRECYYCAVGYDRMETTGSIFAFTYSYDQDFQMQKHYEINVPPAEQSKNVRLNLEYFCIDYKPISKKKAKVTLAIKANFKLKFLPLFILQKSARMFAFDYFENIVKNAKNYKGSVFEKKVNSNPSLYNFFQSKVDEYLK